MGLIMECFVMLGLLFICFIILSIALESDKQEKRKAMNEKIRANVGSWWLLNRNGLPDVYFIKEVTSSGYIALNLYKDGADHWYTLDSIELIELRENK